MTDRFSHQGGARFARRNMAEGGSVQPQSPPGPQTAIEAPPSTGGGASATFWNGIQETARALQIPAAELATIISYETSGSLNPMQPGPTTQWGQHRGLIQFGEPQAKRHGVDFSSPEAALTSQLGKDGAIVKYALSSGFKPGEMDAGDLYSTINAGAPGRMGASDANNGGAPGTVQDKYTTQMNAHREKMYAQFGQEIPDYLAEPGGYTHFRGTEGWNQTFGGSHSSGESRMDRLAKLDEEMMLEKRKANAQAQLGQTLQNLGRSEKYYAQPAPIIGGVQMMAIPEE